MDLVLRSVVFQVDKCRFYTQCGFYDYVVLKKSKFPRYYTKCRRKGDTTRNIPRSISFSPLHFVLYLGKMIYLWESV